ncbi:hypothetical protein ABEB36_011787 [Hypothenemus hampei]|uniref:Uncharacterized protein n=1 Tax=Hypothenemus hampei TaxID=57062 RepID=A0ABD1E9V3_HYPHA
MSLQVNIFYGPYLCHGIINHRPQRIAGLKRALINLGYTTETIPINEYNRVSIQMFQSEIFRCDIRNLMFNMPAEDDPVCQRALAAIEDAKLRMGVMEKVPSENNSG